MSNDTMIRDMFFMSETKPRIRERLISRDQYLDFLDGQLEENRVLCVQGEEGVGVTTTLALFAKRHGSHCASYFNNGWSRYLLSPKAIVSSLRKQLEQLIGRKFNVDEDENENGNENEKKLTEWVYRLNKLARSKNRFVYFVFDGFDNLPVVFVDGVRSVLAPLFSVESARFIFSGSAQNLKQLIPDGVVLKQTNELFKFQKNDVEGFLKEVDSELVQEDIDMVYDLCKKGNARLLTILMEKLENHGVEKVRDYYQYGEDDFYAEDFDWIEGQEREAQQLMALLAYCEIPMNRQMVRKTLKLKEEAAVGLLNQCGKYVEEDDEGTIALRSDDFRKYLRDRLSGLKNEIELLLIDVIEKSTDMGEQFVYLPALYKHVKDNRQLVDYLSSNNVQHYLVEQQSQAALNAQCEYGYNACTDFETQAAAYFRFAINRSVSREIEKNELSDTEIEALIAVGEDEKAYGLSQSVFLMEERLKCLLIIAQSGRHLNESMREEIDRQIEVLIGTIKFEYIPDKALELAKLMLPVKMEKALEIIDRVAKVTKDRLQIDRLYTAISISFNNEGKTDDNMIQRADIANSKIEDDGLRKMATVMRTIMKESTAAQVVAKMKELPASSQLYFLRFWIPDHKRLADIGEAVEYAVRLVIDSSLTMMPKVTLLRAYCKPLPDMKEDQMRKVVALIDAVVANIKFPTVEYVQLMILVVSAVVKYDEADAKSRLEDLYLEIDELKDKALQAHCKALLLRNYDHLGGKIDEWVMNGRELEKDIMKDITEVLDSSAYHLKVVEGPIAALVCMSEDFVKKVVARMNTAERQSRAYLQATLEYVWQMDVKCLDLTYFERLFKRITYDTTDLFRPVVELVNKVTEVKDGDKNLLKQVYKHYGLLKEVEQPDAMCYIYSMLYVWLSKYYAAADKVEDTADTGTVEDFKTMVKADLECAWNRVSVPSVKVDTGYQIARVLSQISLKNEANEYANKAAEVRKDQWLSSVSCLTAYTMSFGLYAHSLGILIRSGLCKDEDIDEFKKLMEYDGNEVDCIILWSRVALEFYGVNDIERFNSIMNRFVTKSVEKNFSNWDKKRVLYHIAPAMYLNSEAIFYNCLKNYDNCLFNACIEHAARYIQTKYPYSEYTGSSEIEVQVALEKSDYDKLLDLMRHTKDDGFIFTLTDTMSKAIKQNLGNKLSREMQRALWSEMADVICERLPVEGGIQHDGYRIACMAMIDGSKPGGKLDASKLKQEIEAISNRADQAFLYAHVACYMPNTGLKNEFIELAVQKTEGIDYTFDKFNRFTLCLQDSFVAAKSKVREIGKKVMDSLKNDGNGSYSNYQRMLDLVRNHDEQLADAMLEMMDDDPARVQYKKRLRLRMQSSRKIEAAKNDLLQVSRLNNDEQVRFFKKQMECLVKNKTIARDFNTTQSVLKQVYQRPITDTQDAVLYFMENLYKKNQTNKKHHTLLREIHQAIIDNLKIVLAIASGTKEKLERVDRIMSEQRDENSDFVQVGETAKWVRKIMDWYKEHPYDILHIIDPYFHAEDLYIVKMLMDVNNGLNCSILTCKDVESHKNETLNDVFQNGWNRWSSELPGRIEVKSCCYESDQRKTPFHDRWWVIQDVESEKAVGLRMASVSTMGSRIAEVSEMNEDDIASASKLWTRFFQNMVQKVDERKLQWEETKLR